MLKNTEKPDGDVVFLKQVPVHPRDRLAKKTKDDVKFVKQVPLHPRERLKRKRESTLENYSILSKKSKDNDVTFIKQVPLQPRERKKWLEKLNQKVNIKSEIDSAKPKPIKGKREIDKIKYINEQIKAANENTKKLMLGNFNFDPKTILNKRLIFYTTIINEEIIKDKIIEAINDPYNEKYWIEHRPGTILLH